MYTKYPNELYIRFPTYTFSQSNSALNGLSNRCFTLNLTTLNFEDYYTNQSVITSYTITQSSNFIDIYDNETENLIVSFGNTLVGEITGTYEYSSGLSEYQNISISASDTMCRPYYFTKLKARRIFTYHNIRHDGTKLEDKKLYTILAPNLYNDLVEPNWNIYPYSTMNEEDKYNNELRFKPATGSVIEFSDETNFLVDNVCDIKNSYKLIYNDVPDTSATFTILTCSFTLANSANYFVFDFQGPQQYIFTEKDTSKKFKYDQSKYVTINYLGSSLNEVSFPKWSIVDSSLEYPDFNLMYTKYLSGFFPEVEENTRTGVSKPFSLSLLLRTYNFRYWLEHAPENARTCQSNASGRWVNSKDKAFDVYVPFVCAFEYDFSNSALNNSIFSSNISSINNYKNSFVLSNGLSGAIIDLDEIDFYSDETTISDQFSSLNITYLAPFDENLNQIELSQENSFGVNVGITKYNTAISDNKNNLVYLYENNFISQEKFPYAILSSISTLSGQGDGLKYITYENQKELLVLSNRNKINNNHVDIFNNQISFVSCLPVPSFYPNELYVRFPTYNFTTSNSGLNVLSNKCFTLYLSSDNESYENIDLSKKYSFTQISTGFYIIDNSNSNIVVEFENSSINSPTGVYVYYDGIADFQNLNLSASDINCISCSSTLVSSYTNKSHLNYFTVDSINGLAVVNPDPLQMGFGYDLSIIPVQKDISDAVLIVSKPWDDLYFGRLSVYVKNRNQSGFTSQNDIIGSGDDYSICTFPNGGYGTHLSNSGPYLCIGSTSAESFFESVTGSYLELYKFNVSRNELNEITVNKTLTDYMFITGNIVSLDFTSNYFTTTINDRKNKNFYGDHLIVAKEDKTDVYSINFDKFEPLNEINNTFNFVKQYNNGFLGVNNNSGDVKLHTIKQLNM